jgi:hypothetical protein
MWTPDEGEFFIGYEPPMPPRLARFVARFVVALAGALVVWGVTLAAGHVRLDGGTFEFGRPASFSGTIIERPYPALQLDGPHTPATDSLLLVAPGKHGADALVRGLNGRQATLTGTRIRRGAYTMIEVMPESIASRQVSEAPLKDAGTPLGQTGDGPVELTGEVVDSKCFLGVMVPGSGKTHKDCASLCLRGGIPPALFVEDRAGRSSLLLLTGPSGEPIGDQALFVAGEAISVTGTVHREGGWLMLRTDPRSWHRVAR